MDGHLTRLTPVTLTTKAPDSVFTFFTECSLESLGNKGMPIDTTDLLPPSGATTMVDTHWNEMCVCECMNVCVYKFVGVSVSVWICLVKVVPIWTCVCVCVCVHAQGCEVVCVYMQGMMTHCLLLHTIDQAWESHLQILRTCVCASVEHVLLSKGAGLHLRSTLTM